MKTCGMSRSFESLRANYNGFPAFRAFELDGIRHGRSEVIRDERLQFRQNALEELPPIPALALAGIRPVRMQVRAQPIPRVGQPFDGWPSVRPDGLQRGERRPIRT